MEIHFDETSSQFVSTEKILPRMLVVEESKCLLCSRVGKFYCCRKCSEDGEPSFLTRLVSGDEGAQSIAFPGMISGYTKLKIKQLQEQRRSLKEIERRAIEASNSLEKRHELSTSIVLARKRIQALKQLHLLMKNEISDLHKQRTSLKMDIEQLGRRSQRIQLKKTKITDYMSTKKYVIEKAQRSFVREQKSLEAIKKDQIQDLLTHIFPLVGIQQDESYDSDDSADEDDNGDRSLDLIEKEIAEARRLSFVHGRWIYDQREGPDAVRVSIVSSRVTAPADGNYGACEAWLKSLLSTSAHESEEGSPSTSMMLHMEPHKSKGASSYAALYFSAHLMHTLRKILCIFLPYKLHFRVFSNSSMTVQEFLCHVHKLNGNVLALCLRYGVDPQLLQPLHTLPNIQNATETLLHNGENACPSLLSPELIASLEELLEESSDPLPEDEEDKLEESLSEWEVSLHEEDWDSLVPKTSDIITQNQYVSAAFQSQARPDEMGQSQGLVSSAVGWLTKNWWNR